MKFILLALGILSTADAETSLNFGSASELTAFSTSVDGVVSHDPSGGAHGDGSMSVLGGNSKSAYLTSHEIALTRTGSSVSMTLDLGPLFLSSTNLNFVTIGSLGFVPSSKTASALISGTQDCRFTVSLQTYNDPSTHDARLILESCDGERESFGGTSALLYPGHYYRWMFQVTRQAGDVYTLESSLIDLGEDGDVNVSALSSTTTFTNATIGSLTLLSGIGRGGSSAYLNQVDSYTLVYDKCDLLTFSSLSDLSNFITSSGGVVTRSASGGIDGDGVMNLLGGDTKSAYLASQELALDRAGASTCVTLDMGPLSLSSPDQNYLTVGAIGIVPVSQTNLSLVASTQDPRFSVRLQTCTDPSEYDVRLVLESYDGGCEASAGTTAGLVPGHYYRWKFEVVRQIGDIYVLESELFDLGLDGSITNLVLGAAGVFTNSLMGSNPLYSGVSRGNGVAYMNQVDAYKVSTGAARIQPPEIEIWTAEDRQLAGAKTDELYADLVAAVNGGATNFIVPKDNYYLTEPFVVGSLDNLSLDGNGATFWLADTGSLQFSNCQNSAVKNICIDRLYHPFIQGIVSDIISGPNEIDQIMMDLEFGSAKPDATPLYGRALCKSAATGKYYYRPIGYSPDTVTPLSEGKWVWIRDHNNVDPVAPVMQVGDRVAMHTRVPGESGLGVFNCGGMHFVDISVYSAGGFLVKEDGIRSPGNNRYIRLKIIPRPGSSRLGTSTRDGFHSYNQAIGPSLIDCEIAGTFDDGINIHGFMNVIVQKLAGNKYLLASPAARDYEVGATVKFHRKPTMATISDAVITAITPVSASVGDPLYADAVQYYLDEYNTHLRENGRWPEYATVTLDRSISADVYDLAISADYSGAGTRIDGLYMHDGCNRGALIKAPGAVVENSRFENVFFGGLYLTGELSPLEGDFADDVIIRNNWFKNCAAYSIRSESSIYSSFSPLTVLASTAPKAANGYLHIVPGKFFLDLTITSNVIENSAGIAMFVGNVKRGTISDNIISCPLQAGNLYSNLDLTGTVETNYNSPAIPASVMADMAEPLYGIYLVSGESITLDGNILDQAPPVCKGLIGEGAWTSDINH